MIQLYSYIVLHNFYFYQVRDCRTEPVLYRGLTLTWAGYDDTVGGVERVVPSNCGQRVCPAGYSGAHCEQLQVDKVTVLIRFWSV